VTRAADAEVVLTNKMPLTADLIARLPILRYIGVLATRLQRGGPSPLPARGVLW